MARGIEINPDIVSGLVPMLRDSNTFEAMHTVAEHGNSFFRFAHAAFLATLRDRTQYDSRILDAISTGVESYEVLGANVGEPIPTIFGLSVAANFEKNPNYGLCLADTMEESVRELIAKYPYLAQGLQDLCEAQIKDSSPELVAYSLRGAAVMRVAHVEANELWRFERDYNS